MPLRTVPVGLVAHNWLQHFLGEDVSNKVPIFFAASMFRGILDECTPSYYYTYQ
jgi:hypothetical protein